MKNESKSGGGISFLGMLTILFIGLKLTGYVDWSWTWVLSPLWIGFTIGVTLIGIALMIKARIK
jgi:hypothetical protein